MNLEKILFLKIVVILMFVHSNCIVYGQTPLSVRQVSDTVSWWKDARFGMFVHFGVSSALNGYWKGNPVKGYSEWAMRTCKIPRLQYLNEVIKPFNPVDFDAEEWIRLAKNTGMKYLVVTAKHHDGVAMYPSKVSDFSITASKFSRDILGELRDACRKHGLKFGFYYSHAMDWEDKDAPGNDWDYENPGGDRQLFGGREWHKKYPGFYPNILSYLERKALPQIKELIENYQPDLMWFDTPSRMPQELNALVFKYVRLLDPKILINSRVAYYPLAGVDYEDTQDRPYEFYPVDGLWEALPTTNDSYGYSLPDNSHKPSSFFVRLIVKAAARGGNVLLNMGPMGNGQPDPRDVKIFNGIGKWFAINGESIYGTNQSPLPVQNWGEITAKGNKLYLHVFEWPKNGALILSGLKNTITNAYRLSDIEKQSLSYTRINHLDYLIKAAKHTPDAVDEVVVIELAEPISIGDGRRLLLPGSINELRVFDCSFKSRGIEFGDGMKNNINAKKIITTDQTIVWSTRINESAKFEVVVEYQNSGKVKSQDFIVEAPTQLTNGIPTISGNGNRIQVVIGKQKLEGNLSGTSDTSYVQTSLGIVQLSKGKLDIVMKPVKIVTEEFARPKSLYLKPVN
jgi:alpha-L-fucosidase